MRKVWHLAMCVSQSQSHKDNISLTPYICTHRCSCVVEPQPSESRATCVASGVTLGERKHVDIEATQVYSEGDGCRPCVLTMTMLTRARIQDYS